MFVVTDLVIGAEVVVIVFPAVHRVANKSCFNSANPWAKQGKITSQLAANDPAILAEILTWNQLRSGIALRRIGTVIGVLP